MRCLQSFRIPMPGGSYRHGFVSIMHLTWAKFIHIELVPGEPPNYSCTVTLSVDPCTPIFEAPKLFVWFTKHLLNAITVTNYIAHKSVFIHRVVCANLAILSPTTWGWDFSLAICVVKPPISVTRWCRSSCARWFISHLIHVVCRVCGHKLKS